jgi:hypothetical protein
MFRLLRIVSLLLLAVGFVRPVKADVFVFFVVGDSLSMGFCSNAEVWSGAQEPMGVLSRSHVNGSWTEGFSACGQHRFGHNPQQTPWPLIAAPGNLWYPVNDVQGFNSDDTPILCRSAFPMPSIVYGLGHAMEESVLFEEEDIFYFIQLSVGGSYVVPATTGQPYCWGEGASVPSTSSQVNLLEMFWTYHVVPAIQDILDTHDEFYYAGLISSIGGGQIQTATGHGLISSYVTEMNAIRRKISELLLLPFADYGSWPHQNIAWHSPSVSPFNTGTRNADLVSAQSSWVSQPSLANGLTTPVINGLVTLPSGWTATDFDIASDGIHFRPATTMWSGYSAGIDLLSQWDPKLITSYDPTF